MYCMVVTGRFDFTKLLIKALGSFQVDAIQSLSLEHSDLFKIKSY